MKNDELLEEIIEKFVAKTLSEKELELFKNKMVLDEELSQKVNDYKTLLKVAKDKDSLEFKKKLIKINKKYKISNNIETEGTIKIKNRLLFLNNNFVKIAAIAVVVLGVLLFYFTNSSTSSFQEIYQNNYQPYSYDSVVRGSNIASDSIIDLYNKGQYNQIVSSLNKIVDTTQNKKWYLYLASSYIGLDKPAFAIDILNDIEKNNAYYEISQWYKLLAYIKSENTIEIKNTANQIITYDGIYKEKTINILNQVKQL